MVMIIKIVYSNKNKKSKNIGIFLFNITKNFYNGIKVLFIKIKSL